MSRYLWINLISVSVPFLYSFVPPVNFYRKVRYVGWAVLTAGGGYIAWDVWATHRGDWGFAPEFVSGIRWLGLPLEEILFFVAIPYACLFTYEQLAHYIPEKKIAFPRLLNGTLAAVFLGAALVFWGQGYTRSVMLSCFLFFVVSLRFRHSYLESRAFWLYILVTYLPFFIVNYLLTSPPIVWYRPESIWGVRVTTIPLEDFFYSFSMLSFYYWAYRFARDRSRDRSQGRNRDRAAREETGGKS